MLYNMRLERKNFIEPFPSYAAPKIRELISAQPRAAFYAWLLIPTVSVVNRYEVAIATDSLSTKALLPPIATVSLAGLAS